ARDADTGIDAPLLGTTNDLERVIRDERVDRVLLAIPAAMHLLSAALTERAEHAGASAHWLAPLSDTLAGRTGGTPGVLDLASLIGRSARPVDGALVRSVVARKRVLITGAGGSIGSEITRIVAAHDPEEVILMERSENALFEIDRELGSAGVPRRAVLHDVVDSPRTLALMRQLRPHAVFHAAAHKHVPMMETHPGAAITNNVFGTKSVLDGALAADAERFVFVSTDKAVHPTSVMGATKRLAELYVRSRAEDSATRCSLVRFGNVLGSACSVLPIWDRQIARGEAITVTDERMTRYFMTIPEAASLVIQSAGVPQGDEAGVYVLDMGEPIRIADLAQRLLEQRGVAGGVGIAVTGARPGEKLYEELAYSTEQLAQTAVPGVRAWAGSTPERGAIDAMIGRLDAARSDASPERVVEAIVSCVPEMRRDADAPTGARVVTRSEIPSTSRAGASHAA
ncbi:MAG: polysaccharide biosynthesis protein, partial [Planctomycetota bacterium]